jgi:hypothetical protein
LVTIKVIEPLAFGSGKSGTPWARMHCENWAALVEFSDCDDAGVPLDPAAELPVVLFDELPPQPASATRELASTTATPAAPRRRAALRVDFVFALARTRLMFIIGLPP